MKKKKAPVKTSKLELMNLKLKKSERNKIKVLARKYALGNVSHWIRYASMNFKPFAKDLPLVPGK